MESREELLAGRYRTLRSLGAGGMARVYLADDERLRRQVAVKRLHADSPEDAAQRFEREARFGAALNHPNLVAIYDIDSDGESVLIVMEYVDGETLQRALRAGPLATPRALAAARDVAAALDHAHSHGVVHRDVKPANILLRSDGIAKLADLGIATVAEGTRITRSGVVLGTASYMAPEQLDGREAGPRADVYALAAVAFEALAGRRARAGSTPMEVAHNVVNEPPPDLRDAWPAAPDGAAEALRQGMAVRPEDRPASAGALVAALEAGVRPPTRTPTRPTLAAPAEPPAGSAGGTTPYAVRRGSPRWLPVALALVAICVVGIVALASLGGGDGAGGDGSDPEGSAAARQERGDGSRGAQDGPATEPAPTPQDATPPVEEPAEEPAPAPEEPVASDDPQELNDAGFALMNEGRYDEAIPLLERAVGAYPPEGSDDVTYAFALYNLGRSLRLAGRPDEAIPILERRLEIPNQQATVQRELDAARREAG